MIYVMVGVCLLALLIGMGFNYTMWRYFLTDKLR
jgi:hypothetical protein